MTVSFIPADLIINLDQTPLSYISPGKYTFNMKGAKHVPVKGVDDKRQITATFAVSVVGFVAPGSSFALFATGTPIP